MESPKEAMRSTVYTITPNVRCRRNAGGSCSYTASLRIDKNSFKGRARPSLEKALEDLVWFYAKAASQKDRDKAR